MIRHNFPDTRKIFRLRRAHHVHHIFSASPFLRFAQHFFVKCSALRQFLCFKIKRAFVARERQQDHPFVFIRKKRFHRIASHIRSNRHRIETVMLKKRTRIHRRRIPDIAALGICNRKTIGRNYLHCFLQALQTFYTIRFIKSKIWFVSHTKIMRRFDDLAVEFKNRISLFQ